MQKLMLFLVMLVVVVGGPAPASAQVWLRGAVTGAQRVCARYPNACMNFMRAVNRTPSGVPYGQAIKNTLQNWRRPNPANSLANGKLRLINGNRR